MPFIQTSLLITTYNWPAALKLCLHSVLRQTRLPDEILIADDGSRNDTKTLIEQFQKISQIPITHIWHEDNGFQLSVIRNKAIAQAKFEYIIQIDGDVILENHFIEDHMRICQTDYFVIGSRSNLNESDTKKILAGKQIPDNNFFKTLKRFNLNSQRNIFISKFLSDKYKVKGKNKNYAKGCNMAYWKEDAIAINGYNEQIIGWGSEDEEFVIRLFKLGKNKLFLKMGGVVFHLWHKIASRAQEIENKQVLKKAEDSLSYFCAKGIDQYL